MANITYSLNGNDFFSTYGIRVSASFGLVEPLATKPPQIQADWPNEHGAAIDLSQVVYQPRNIQLQCFLVADNNDDFIAKVQAFEAELRKPNSQRLTVWVHSTKPLIYQVYCPDAISINKQFRNGGQVVGELSINLIEPETVKKVIKYTGAGTFTASWTSPKTYQVYYDDGTKQSDLYGAFSLSKTFATAGDHYIVITGDIDSIASFTTNGTTTWSKLQ